MTGYCVCGRSRATEKLQYITFIGRERQPYGDVRRVCYIPKPFLKVWPYKTTPEEELHNNTRVPTAAGSAIPQIFYIFFRFHQHREHTIADLGFPMGNR